MLRTGFGHVYLERTWMTRSLFGLPLTFGNVPAPEGGRYSTLPRSGCRQTILVLSLILVGCGSDAPKPAEQKPSLSVALKDPQPSLR